MKNTSIFLGDYFEQFVNSQVTAGRYKNVSEVIRGGLRLLENEETKTAALKNAIQQGLNSPCVESFDFDEHIAKTFCIQPSSFLNLLLHLLHNSLMKFCWSLGTNYINQSISVC